jgi:TRAP-type uncharacterized transport system fused permease subunit
VFDQGLLLQGDALHILHVVTTATIGVVTFSAAIGGYAFGPLNWPVRIALLCMSPLLIDPNPLTDIIGAVGLAVVFVYQLWRYRLGHRAKPVAATTRT